MVTLIADRFLRRFADKILRRALARPVETIALDLATAHRVRLQLAPAGDRVEQQAWSERSAAAYRSGRLIDFGFLGQSLRFEARCHRQRQITTQRTEMSWSGIVGWLEDAPASTARVVWVTDLPESRVLRIHGFVPCSAGLFDQPRLAKQVIEAIAARSLCVLDDGDRPAQLAAVLLRLRSAAPRDVRTLVRRPTSRPERLVAAAAESRSTYGCESGSGDPRARQWLADGSRLADLGRHAAAERTLRAALAAFDRRRDRRRGADAMLRLGRLLRGRGRASEACRCFESACERFQAAGSTMGAFDATILVGLVQVDLNHLTDAERTCRHAYSAATALENAEALGRARLALARTLYWQDRFGDVRTLLESSPPGEHPDERVRHWCLVAKLAIRAEAFAEARQAIAQIARADRLTSPVVESLVRLREAAIQAGLGDLDALRLHVTAGLAAARAGHLPLRGIALRLILIEGLLRCGSIGAARSACRYPGRMRGGAIPPLLEQRIAAVLKLASDVPVVPARRPAMAAHETAPYFRAITAGDSAEPLDGLREIVSLAHHTEDERAVLSSATAVIRKCTHAAATGIFGYGGGAIDSLAASGLASASLAQRSADVGQLIGPTGNGEWVDVAVPVRYAGRIVGAIAVRWSLEGPDGVDRTLAFVHASAAVCAPLLYLLLERRQLADPAEDALDIIGGSPAMAELRRGIRRAANAPFAVLIEGESGSGKELVARAIHRSSGRRERRFCAFNCAAMPEELIDSELFGYARGAFTGATVERVGLVESADGGSLFLDEVGELSARAQAKLLRTIQEGEIRRIGENATRPVDARLIAATNRNLRDEVQAQRFRQDLLYRLDVIRITVPPLRERPDDIPLLAAAFWRQLAERMGSKASLGKSTVAALARYDWPGNVRELQNVLATLAVAMPSSGVVSSSALPASIASAARGVSCEPLECARQRFEERYVRAVLARTAGHRGQAAAALGITRQGLAKLMQRLHLDTAKGH